MRLETPRLVLREYAEGDSPAVLAYQRDARYLRYYPWEDRTLEDVQRFVRAFIDWQSESPRRRFQLAVLLRGSGPLIGSCGVRRKPDDDTEADIGFELSPEHWGRGYATEAATAMAGFAFRELGVRRLSSWCIAENNASARVLEKLGMLFEGRLPAAEHFKGRDWDTLLYGMTHERWEGAAR
ncbi:MAG: GNAT family N-acetyltransferase [Chloroflexota bacterium]|nr:GNAT family N-acetyltransferase [Chloroflexota bacterium]MDE2885643.1 GNAT family N-acetyltransferase [Chloroflexota bacterium]